MTPGVKNEEIGKKEIAERPKGIGYRHLQFLLYFTGVTTLLSVRTNFSIALVDMTTESESSNFDVYDWDEVSKGFILSGFAWGCVVSQIPAGAVAHTFGAKYILLSVILVSSLIPAFTPLLATLGWEFVLALRVVIGLFQGFAMPCIFTLMPRWIHPRERGLSAIVLAANPFGAFLALVISGAIADSNAGWPGIFYTFAGMGVLWSVCWLFLGSEKPSEHKSISTQERIYLEKDTQTSLVKKLPVPWGQILRSLPVYSLIIASFTEIWGQYILLTETPAYMVKFLDFNIKKSALWSGIPYLCKTITCIIFSLLSDLLINRQYLSRGATRKLFSILSTWIPAACLIGIGFNSKETSNVAVALFTISYTFNAGSYVGHLINVVDITPNFSGTVSGLVFGIAHLASIIAPIFVGYVVPDPTNEAQWRIVFLVTAGLISLGNLCFLIFGKATVQHWNEEKVT